MEKGRRGPACPCCGCADFEWLGQAFENVAYIRREDEGSFALTRNFPARLRVCLDCGFVGFFADRETRERMAKGG